jgi:hypothetical protein
MMKPDVQVRCVSTDSDPAYCAATGKRRFRSLLGAQMRLAELDGMSGNRSVRAYRCHKCNGWHLTKRPR